MPNWVSNSVRVTGSKEELQRFAEQAARPYEHPFGGKEETHLSFWNFVRPDESIMHEYTGAERQDLTLEERLQYKTNHWYDWNIRNWGCKWDARDVYFEDWDGELGYDFETPWGPPIEVFQAMTKQYPTLTFTIRFLEEQGWGGEACGANGEFSLLKEWDVPNTHEERMEYIGYCYCEEMGDDEQEWMYKDCPKRKELADAK